MAVLVVIVALAGGRGTLESGADAQVDLQLTGSTDIDAARQALIADATGNWQATRVAESAASDDEATVEFALPGASLDGLIAALRRHPDARSVEVNLEVDPEQLSPATLGAENQSAPEPVRLQVNLSRDTSSAPLVTFVGALLVAIVAAVALMVVWRRFGSEDDGRFEDGPRLPRTNNP